MTIEFQCPQCAVVIRVADEGAGKRGKCPSCSALVRIPVPEIAADVAGAAPAPPQEIPDFPANFDAQATPTPVSRRLWRRRRSRRAILIPIAFGTILLAGIVYYYSDNREVLRGELQAIVLSAPQLQPGLVALEKYDIEEDVVQSMIAGLQESPQFLKSRESVDVEFRGSDIGLEVRIFGAPKWEFIVLNLQQDRRLWEYVQAHAREFDAPRVAELSASVPKFAKDWNQSQGDTAKLLAYRNQIGLNSLTGGAGYQVEALVGSQRFRCVYQDDSKLYFLLPKGIQSFVLQGRQFDETNSLFNGRFTVTIARDDSAVGDSDTSDHSSKPEPEPIP